jgi:hypothetical protein
MTGEGGLVEVQATAERTPLSRAHLDELLALAAKGIEELRAAQDEAIERGLAAIGGGDASASGGEASPSASGEPGAQA